LTLLRRTREALHEVSLLKTADGYPAMVVNASDATKPAR